MMQMEWCNQFDSSVSIHGEEEGEGGREETREDASICHVVIFFLGFSFCEYIPYIHLYFKSEINKLYKS